MCLLTRRVLQRLLVVTAVWLALAPHTQAQQTPSTEVSLPEYEPLFEAERKLSMARLEIAAGAFLILAAPPAFITGGAFASMDAEYCEEDEDPARCEAKYDAVFRRYMFGLGIVAAAGTALVVHGFVRAKHAKKLRDRLRAADHLAISPRLDGVVLGANWSF